MTFLDRPNHKRPRFAIRPHLQTLCAQPPATHLCPFGGCLGPLHFLWDCGFACCFLSSAACCFRLLLVLLCLLQHLNCFRPLQTNCGRVVPTWTAFAQCVVAGIIPPFPSGCEGRDMAESRVSRGGFVWLGLDPVGFFVGCRWTACAVSDTTAAGQATPSPPLLCTVLQKCAAATPPLPTHFPIHQQLPPKVAENTCVLFDPHGPGAKVNSLAQEWTP